MSVLSGLSSKVSVNGTSALASLKNWKISPSANNPKAVSSSSGSAQYSITGVKDFTGSASFDGASSLGFLVPGTKYTFYGQNDTDEVQAGIIVTDVEYNCDIEGGGFLGGTVNFASIGSSTLAGSDNTPFQFQAPTSLTNSSAPSQYGGIGCKAMWDPLTGGTYAGNADIPDVRNWSLRLASEVQAYASSSTGGVTKRVAGAKSASFSIGLYQADWTKYTDAATILTPGQLGRARLYVSASAYWLFTYGIVDRLDIETPIDNSGLITGSVQFSYSAYALISSTFTRGTITDPDSVAFIS